MRARRSSTAGTNCCTCLDGRCWYRTMNQILPAQDATPTRAYNEHVACCNAARRSIFAALAMKTDERADETIRVLGVDIRA